jgi:hypothetical protein
MVSSTPLCSGGTTQKKGSITACEGATPLISIDYKHIFQSLYRLPRIENFVANGIMAGS